MKLTDFKVFLILLVAFQLVSCKKEENKGGSIAEQAEAKLPYFGTADFTPQWEKVQHRIPDFSFFNQNGEKVSNANYTGKIYIADFFFTSCPGICPKLTKHMGELQEIYRNDPEVVLLSHSVMPWYDTVEVLKEYAEENGVDDSTWDLVTGEQSAIYKIAREGYFADEDFAKTQVESKFIHTENFILVDSEGYIRGVYNGTLEMELARLKRHIALLKKEKEAKG